MNNHADAAKPAVSETWAFAVTVFLVFPAAAVAFVGSFGLVVWLIQAVFGPPAPPG
ncbi:MAG: hypothetical protein ACYYKD_05880 [Rhodospirillales bacterium]